MNLIKIIATATFGLEAIVAREVKKLGYKNTKVVNGKVSFMAEMKDIPRLNIWLRCADRILIEVDSFEAGTFEELFQGIRRIPWEKWMLEDTAFPVLAKAVKSQLMSVPDIQKISKKAIVERLKSKFNINWFEETAAKMVVEVGILNDVVTVTLDTSGGGLHRRGYRQLAGGAPLKETLASALVQLSYWRHERLLCDPFCGSGTILVEAAMLERNMAPGLKKAENGEFDAMKWHNVDAASWDMAIEEAYDSVRRNIKLNLQGYDVDDRVLRLARSNSEIAGVADDISYHQRDVYDFQSSYKYGVIITNPPYGERLGGVKEAEGIYKTLGKVIKEYDSWSVYVLTAHQEFEKFYGKKADRKRKLYNGRIRCDYYQYYGPRPPKKIIKDES